METLPNELTLDIAMKMTAADCLALAKSANRFGWLLNEVSLWKHFMKTELKRSDQVFDQHMKFRSDLTSPAHVYQRLSQCQYLIPIDKTFYNRFCGKPVFPGAPYCREHCIGTLVRCRSYPPDYSVHIITDPRLYGVVIRLQDTGIWKIVGEVDQTSSCGNTYIPISDERKKIAISLGLEP
jgi:hypothetical protein